jgi:hypothetical protein
MTNAEIDEFMDDAIAELEEIRSDAKEALPQGLRTEYIPKMLLKPSVGSSS